MPRKTRTCPTCHLEIAANNLARHMAKPHDAVCTICGTHCTAHTRCNNNSAADIRTHMYVAHRVQLPDGRIGAHATARARAHAIPFDEWAQLRTDVYAIINGAYTDAPHMPNERTT